MNMTNPIHVHALISPKPHPSKGHTSLISHTDSTKRRKVAVPTMADIQIKMIKTQEV